MVDECRMQRSRKKEGQPLAGMHPKVDANVGEATRNPRQEVEMSYEVRPRPRYDPTNARADTVAKPLSEPPQQGRSTTPSPVPVRSTGPLDFTTQLSPHASFTTDHTSNPSPCFCSSRRLRSIHRLVLWMTPSPHQQRPWRPPTGSLLPLRLPA